MSIPPEVLTQISLPEWDFVVGRLGEFKNLVSRADLNGSLGRIMGFNCSTKRFCVTTIGQENISIKSENFVISGDETTLCPPELDVKRYGAEALGLGSELTDGSIVILGGGSGTNVPHHPVVRITKNCVIRGIGKACKIESMFNISINNGLRVEFENIDFLCQFANAVIIEKGEAIFRNCTFSATDAAFAADTNSSVWFDSCRFENTRGSGIICEANFMAMKNCTIRQNGGFGIEVREGGRLIATECKIMDTGRASVIGYRHANSIELLACSISRSGDSGVLVAEGCSATIRNCTIEEAAAAGVAVQQRASIVVENSTISKCSQGVLVQTGKCNAVIKDCVIEKNKMCGIFIGMDCRGKVDIVGNTLRKNRFRDVNNDASESSCAVTMNGSIFPKQGFVMTAPPSLRQAALAQSEEILKTMDPQTYFLESQAALKARAAVGLADIICGACSKIQQKNEKFLLCSQCMEVRYCNKDCQKLDWKQGHKAKCIKRVRYQALLHPGTEVVRGTSKT
jgi:hypothetical protein